MFAWNPRHVRYKRTGPVEDVRLTSVLFNLAKMCCNFSTMFAWKQRHVRVQTNIEITVPVEDVRLTSELESSSNPRRCLVLRRKSIVQHRALHVTLKIVLDILANVRPGVLKGNIFGIAQPDRVEE